MDRGGTSDPYVLIKQDGDALYRSNEKKKTVNPVWNDQANVCVENPYTPLVYEVNKCYTSSLWTLDTSLLQVYDRDVVGSDDFMGSAEFDLTSLEFHKSQEVTLHLGDAGDEDLIRSLCLISSLVDSLKDSIIAARFRKNKKKKSLGYIIVRMTLSTLTKEEYNEVFTDFHLLDWRVAARAYNFLINFPL